MKTVLMLLSSNFFKFGRVTLICAMQPNVLNQYTVGFSPCHASYGVLPARLSVAEQFNINTAVLTASLQNALDIFFVFNRRHAMDTIV